MKVLLTLALGFVLVSCAGSYRNQRAEDLKVEFRKLVKKYQDAEDEYFNVLSNLERLPDEVFLLKRQGELKQELLILATEMQYMDKESAKALKEWEESLVNKQKDMRILRKAENEADHRIRKAIQQQRKELKFKK